MRRIQDTESNTIRYKFSLKLTKKPASPYPENATTKPL